jgi:probable HAF family extracellular repeat protein
MAHFAPAEPGKACFRLVGAGLVGGVLDRHRLVERRGSGGGDADGDLDVLDGDTNGQALGINDRGQVVGLSRVAGRPDTAVIWRGEQIADLNALAPDYAGHLLFANDINNAGAITGMAISAEFGHQVAFLATPTRGPSAGS